MRTFSGVLGHVVLLAGTMNFPLFLVFFGIEEELSLQLWVSFFLFLVVMPKLISRRDLRDVGLPLFATISALFAVFVFSLFFAHDNILNYRLRYSADLSILVSTYLFFFYYLYIRSLTVASRMLFMRLALLALVGSTFIVAAYLLSVGLNLRAQSFYAAAVLSPICILLLTNYVFPNLFFSTIIPVILSGSFRSLILYLFRLIYLARFLLKKKNLRIFGLGLGLAFGVVLVLVSSGAADFSSVRGVDAVLRSGIERLEFANVLSFSELQLIKFDLTYFSTQRYHQGNAHSNPHSTLVFVAGTFGVMATIIFVVVLVVRLFMVKLSMFQRFVLLIVFCTETMIFRTPFVSALIFYASLNRL